MKALPTSVVAVVLALLIQPALANNLVRNPGFEAGFSDWSTSGFGLYRPPQVATGDAAAYTGCVGHNCLDPVNGAFLQQTLPTAPGMRYDLSFWVAENSGPAAEMAVFWDGQQISEVSNPASDACEGRFSICHFVEYSYAGLLAETDATVLQINARQDPGYMIFDDFSVTPVTQADEPGSFRLMGVGVLGALALVGGKRCSTWVRLKVECPQLEGL